MSFSRIYEQAILQKGGENEVRARLPAVAEPGELETLGDDRYLSEITRCIFKAVFVWRVIENKWPKFEEAFEGFVPLYWQQVPPEVLEQLAGDERIVRNAQKIQTVPENARMIVDAAREHGSFGKFLADWPRKPLTAGTKRAGCPTATFRESFRLLLIEPDRIFERRLLFI